MFRSNPQNSADAAAITIVLEEAPHGATLTWLDFEQHTGVKMDRRGRALAVRMVRRLGREYEALPATGIRLSSPDNALLIAEHANHKIGRAINGAARVTARLAELHAAEMTEDDRARLIRNRGFLGALRASAGDAVRMLLPKKE